MQKSEKDSNFNLMKKLLLLCLLFSTDVFAQAPQGEVQVHTNPSGYSVLPKNAIRIPFLKIEIIAKEETLSITGFEISRGGLSSISGSMQILIFQAVGRPLHSRWKKY